jgi:hypothetical protein
MAVKPAAFELKQNRRRKVPLDCDHKEILLAQAMQLIRNEKRNAMYGDVGLGAGGRREKGAANRRLLLSGLSGKSPLGAGL